MGYVDFLSVIHKATSRDYLARVNDPDYPKHKAAELAKKWDYDYWDGDRRINYGGYRYIPGRWEKVARAMAEACNAFLAMKISFINAVASVCELVGANVNQVVHGIGTDTRIGPRFLNPGIDYGGSCFPKDVMAFRAWE